MAILFVAMEIGVWQKIFHCMFYSVRLTLRFGHKKLHQLCKVKKSSPTAISPLDWNVSTHIMFTLHAEQQVIIYKQSNYIKKLWFFKTHLDGQDVRIDIVYTI